MSRNQRKQSHKHKLRQIQGAKVEKVQTCGKLVSDSSGSDGTSGTYLTAIRPLSSEKRSEVTKKDKPNPKAKDQSVTVTRKPDESLLDTFSIGVISMGDDSSGVKSGIYDAVPSRLQCEEERGEAIANDLIMAEEQLHFAQSTFNNLEDFCAVQQQRFFAGQEPSWQHMTQTEFDVEILRYKMQSTTRLLEAENVYICVEQRMAEFELASNEKESDSGHLGFRQTHRVPESIQFLDAFESQRIMKWRGSLPDALSGSPSSAVADESEWHCLPVEFDECNNTYTIERHLRRRIDQIDREMEEARKILPGCPTDAHEMEQVSVSVSDTDSGLEKSKEASGYENKTQSLLAKQEIDGFMAPIRLMMDGIISAIPDTVL